MKYRKGIHLYIGNDLFTSISQAARAIGKDKQIVAYRLRSTNYPNYRYAPGSNSKFFTIINNSVRIRLYENRGKSRVIPVKIDNITYPSITSASKALHVSRTTIYRKLHSLKYPNYIYLPDDL